MPDPTNACRGPEVTKLHTRNDYTEVPTGFQIIVRPHIRSLLSFHVPQPPYQPPCTSKPPPRPSGSCWTRSWAWSGCSWASSARRILCYHVGLTVVVSWCFPAVWSLQYGGDWWVWPWFVRGNKHVWWLLARAVGCWGGWVDQECALWPSQCKVCRQHWKGWLLNLLFSATTL